MFYDGPTPPAGVFDEIDKISSLIDDTATKNYYQISQEAGGASINGFGNSFRAATIPNLPEDQMVDYMSYYWNQTYQTTFVDGLQDLDVQVTGFDPQPLAVPIMKASQAQGGNCLGLNPDHGDRIWIENNLLWTNPTCNDKCPQQSEELTNRLIAYQKQKYGGVAPTNYKSGDLATTNYNPLFLNDAAPNQDVYASYGQENLQRLKQIKQAYDPKGFFTTRQGGFKLSN